MFVVLCLFFLLGATFALPNGAPNAACGKMKPEHFLPSSKDEPSPFRFSLSSNTYMEGQKITGTLSAGNITFKGFLIEVGTMNDPSQEEKAVGKFTDLDSSFMKHVCGEGGITHVNNQEKSEVKFTWQAPSTTNGDLYVRATVVKEYKPFRANTLWMNAFSDALKPATHH